MRTEKITKNITNSKSIPLSVLFREAGEEMARRYCPPFPNNLCWLNSADRSERRLLGNHQPVASILLGLPWHFNRICALEHPIYNSSYILQHARKFIESKSICFVTLFSIFCNHLPRRIYYKICI